MGLTCLVTRKLITANPGTITMVSMSLRWDCSSSRYNATTFRFLIFPVQSPLVSEVEHFSPTGCRQWSQLANLSTPSVKPRSVVLLNNRVKDTMTKRRNKTTTKKKRMCQIFLTVSTFVKFLEFFCRCCLLHLFNFFHCRSLSSLWSLRGNLDGKSVCRDQFPGHQTRQPQS